MDYAMIIIWGIIMVLTIIIEVETQQMVSVWFSCASIVSIILACLNAPRWLQFCAFVAATVLLLILTKPLVGKLKKTPERTNVDLIIGQSAVVTETIHNELSKGRATVGGVSWMAVSSDGSVIEKDEVVKIMAIDGAKLIVSRV